MRRIGLLEERRGKRESRLEIIAALRPSMATVPGSMLLCASSPYARRGVLWDAFRKHHGKDGPVLVWKAGTRAMNPTVPEAVIAEAYESDPASAAAEYGAEFRIDVETYIAREVVEIAVMRGRHRARPRGRELTSAFVDPSGGSSDSYHISHRSSADGRRCRARTRSGRSPPFSPEAVVDEFAKLLKSYGIHACRATNMRRVAGRGVPEVRHPVRAERRAESRTCIATYCRS